MNQKKKKFCILIQISLKFVPKSPIDNKPALIQVMAWHQAGNKPLPEPNVDPVHWHIYAAHGADELTSITILIVHWYLKLNILIRNSSCPEAKSG